MRRPVGRLALNVPNELRAPIDRDSLVERLGAIVLCGGRSRRMGRPKEWLPIGDEAMLLRMIRIVSTRASLVVVSAASGQELPPLPRHVEIVVDATPDLGPLQGIATGLEALIGRVGWAYATATDAPFLVPGWIDRLLELSGPDHDLILPHVEGRDHPLSALYRPEVSVAASRRLASGHRKLGLLREAVRTRLVPSEELADVDPGFRTLVNLNTPGDLESLDDLPAPEDDEPLPGSDLRAPEAS